MTAAIDAHKVLATELQAMGREARKGVGPRHHRHLRNIRLAGWGLTVLGLATAWIAPNPIAILGLALGRFSRWTIVAHHVIHKGYDGEAKGKWSQRFGRGWRRLIDWPDWLVADAWHQEHDVLHHYRLNELEDPDCVEENVAWIKIFPRSIRALGMFGFMCMWRWFWYAPHVLRHLDDKHNPGQVHPGRFPIRYLNPLRPEGRRWLGRAIAPAAFFQFILLPALFLPLGWQAAAFVLINSLLAEVVANLHTFMVIVPNHVGTDLWRFDQPPANKADFMLRQIGGSANYRGGTEIGDFLQGYLNYQVEHHLWPDLPALAYRELRPQMRDACARHGLPYIEESVFVRWRKTWTVLMGDAKMPHIGRGLDLPLTG